MAGERNRQTDMKKLIVTFVSFIVSTQRTAYSIMSASNSI
jgi:hypothetical protein